MHAVARYIVIGLLLATLGCGEDSPEDVAVGMRIDEVVDILGEPGDSSFGAYEVIDDPPDLYIWRWDLDSDGYFDFLVETLDGRVTRVVPDYYDYSRLLESPEEST
jgi:hypothetical protein